MLAWTTLVPDSRMSVSAQSLGVCRFTVELPPYTTSEVLGSQGPKATLTLLDSSGSLPSAQWKRGLLTGADEAS